MADQAVKLTKRVVDSAKLKEARYILWDCEVRGFGLRVEASGTKTYLLRYRPRNVAKAPKRFVTIGRHGPVTADQARSQALQILGRVAAGNDPASAPKGVVTRLKVSEAVDLFLKNHVAAKRKAKTLEGYSGTLRRTVVPAIGKIDVLDLKRADVMKLHGELAITPYLANHMLAVVGSMYTYLAKTGHVAEGMNPTRGVERYREQGRERYLTGDELARIGAALREAETVGLPWEIDPNKKSKHLAKPGNQRTILDPFAVAAIRLLILTGARLREILHLKWSEVDIQRGLAFLEDSKTGRKTLVLSTAAVDLLRCLSRDGQYVIRGAKIDTPRADLKKPWSAIQSRAGLSGIRLHDLRHTFASIGAGASLGLPIVGKLLGHTQAQTTARYAHLDADPLRKAADIIATQIDASMRAINGA